MMIHTDGSHCAETDTQADSHLASDRDFSNYISYFCIALTKYLVEIIYRKKD